MRILGVVLALAFLSLSACKSSDKAKVDKVDGKGGMAGSDTKVDDKADAKVDDKVEPGISEAEAITVQVADEMCACTDAACAGKVVQTHGAAMTKISTYKPATPEEGARLMAASKRMSDCATKIPQ